MRRRCRYGTEVVVAAVKGVQWAFGLARVVARTSSANVVSRRMLVRAGFPIQGGFVGPSRAPIKPQALHLVFRAEGAAWGAKETFNWANRLTA